MLAVISLGRNQLLAQQRAVFVGIVRESPRWLFKYTARFRLCGTLVGGAADRVFGRFPAKNLSLPSLEFI